MLALADSETLNESETDWLVEIEALALCDSETDRLVETDVLVLADSLSDVDSLVD